MNKFGLQLIVASLCLASAAVAETSVATLAPAPAVFTRVHEQARELGYFGYDTMVCLSTADRIVAGGVSFWNAPLQLFLVDGHGKTVKTERLSEADEQDSIRFDANGKEVNLQLGKSSRSASQNILAYDAHLTVGPTEIAQIVKCYMQMSGLE